MTPTQGGCEEDRVYKFQDIKTFLWLFSKKVGFRGEKMIVEPRVVGGSRNSYNIYLYTYKRLFSWKQCSVDVKESHHLTFASPYQEP